MRYQLPQNLSCSLIHDSYLKESRNRLEECIFLHAVSNLAFQQSSINDHIPEIYRFIWLCRSIVFDQYTPHSWSTSCQKAISITTNYIKFSSFLWAFTWYHSWKEEHGTFLGQDPMGPALPPVFWQQNSTVSPPKSKFKGCEPSKSSITG